MDLLQQCQKWLEDEEYQKIKDTLEAIPIEERTPEIDSELARAYIAGADVAERESFEKALDFWRRMRNILRKIIAGTIGLLLLIITWIKKVPLCAILKKL